MDKPVQFPEVPPFKVYEERGLSGEAFRAIRRERIATAVMAGFATIRDVPANTWCAQAAVEWADALIAELDKK